MASFRRDSVEDDDYWSASKVNKSKFNLFDDNVTVETADSLAKSKKLLTSAFADDDVGDEDVENINWDGTPVAVSSSNTGYRQDVSQAEPLPSSSQNPPSAARQTSGKPPTPVYMTHSRSQSVTFGIPPKTSIQPSTGSVSYSKSHEKLPTSPSSFPTRPLFHNAPSGAPSPSIQPSTISQSSNLEDAMENSHTKPHSRDPTKMAEQIQFLQRSLQKAKQGMTALPVEDTVKRMINGEPYSLEVYKSKEDKLALLDQTIALHDGNSIIAVILFLKKSVKASIFNLELQKRPVAVNHYISYLRAHYDFKDLVDLLGMLNRTEEASMLKYKQAISSYDARSKIASLKGCHKAHFSMEPQLGHEASLVQQHISILERQWPLEDADAKAAKNTLHPQHSQFRQYPRKANLINMPVITTLYYCCFYHSRLGENNLASPLAIKNEHQLTEKQYVWTALKARSRLKQWNGVEELLKTKGWFGSTKSHSVIGFDRVCEVLYSTSAPLDILSKYLRQIQNQEKRINMAKKYKCHDVAVDALVSQKDRIQLEQYASKLPQDSREFFYARDALQSSTLKWKN